MHVMLVTYDLNEESRRPPIAQVIQDEAIECVKLSESSYAVLSVESPSQFYKILKSKKIGKEYLIDENDVLHVISLSKPFASHSKKGIKKWLQDNL